MRPDVVEDLGSETHVIFTIDAPRVSADAVRAATDLATSDEGKLFADDQRASSPLRRRATRGRRPARTSSSRSTMPRLHFFDPATGDALGAGARAVAFA